MKSFQFFSFLWLLLLPALFSCGAQPSAAQSTVDAPKSDQNASEGTQVADYVVDVFEDSKGIIWFGTMRYGAGRYDGKELTYLTKADDLHENTVVSISEDTQGNLWFGSHLGACRYDGKKMQKFGPEEGLTGMGVSIIHGRDGQIWGKSNHGVFRFEEGKFVKFELPKPEVDAKKYKWEPGKIWSMMEDSEGNWWFGLDAYGACRWDGENFRHFTVEDGLNSNNVSTVCEDKEGNIWFGTLSSDFPAFVNDGGVCRYDGNKIEQFPNVKGFTNNDVYTIYPAPTGDVWICPVGIGFYRFDGENYTLFEQSDRPDLTTNFAVQGHLLDSKGRFWVGCSGGLFHFDGEAIVNVTVEDLERGIPAEGTINY